MDVPITENGRSALDQLSILLQSRHKRRMTLDEVLEQAVTDLGGSLLWRS
jgi:hypothetical protein